MRDVLSGVDAGLLVDLVVIGVIVGQGVTGWRQGLLVGVASLGGFAVGLIGGGFLVVELLPSSGNGRLLAVLLGGLVGGIVLQALGVALAYRLRRRLQSSPLLVVDTLVGTVVAVVSAAAVIWLLTWGLRTAPLPVLGRTLAESRVISALDDVAPPAVQAGADRFFARVSGVWFPRVFEGGREIIRVTDPPDTGVTNSPGVLAAADRVVKVRGVAAACNRSQEGSGFVAAERSVVTNAHVVAGMPEPQVQVGGEGRFLPATVVLIDTRRDLAVLRVPDLAATPLRRDAGAEAGDPVAVVGFPNDGPYDVGAGRIRDRLRAVGSDIYGRPGASRDVFSLYAVVRPGNSGGPVLSPDGEVVGVVFARSTSDSSTGYALTVDELNEVLPPGDAPPTEPVPVGSCAVG